jgi:hypothetical protein
MWLGAAAAGATDGPMDWNADFAGLAPIELPDGPAGGRAKTIKIGI